MSQREWEVAEAALSKSFDPSQIKYRAGATTKDKTKAMALAYVDARDVMERLDAAVGRSGWSDSYRLMSEAAVECSLTVLGVTKSDVGYPNSEDDEEPLKSAYSDAFKRAAVKFGIGRDLYAMPTRWVGYDADRKRLILDSVPQEASERPQTRAASSPALPAHTERVVAEQRADDEPPPPWEQARAVFADDTREYKAGDRHDPAHNALKVNAKGLFCPTKVGAGWCDWSPAR